MRNSKLLFVSTLCLSLTSLPAFALDQIIRPYQTVREDGMGGLKLTTGQYDENFFGNPARVTDDPNWRVSLLDLQFEANTNSIKNASTLASSSGGNTLSDIGNTAGSNNHIRMETAFPAYYLGKTNDHRKWSIAVGLFASIQGDVDARANYSVDPTVFVDIGPAVTFGYKLLDDALSVGVTGHVAYRFATNQTITFSDIINGGWSPKNIAGHGGMADADVGATYKIPLIQPLGFDVTVAAAIDNVRGGNFSDFKISSISGNLGSPPTQPRTFNFGGSISRAALGPMQDFVAALEVQDIGNNSNGSLFRTVHLGAESRFSVLRARVGINQGYLCAGLGIDLKVLSIDVATYGEEMSLNPGGEEDRRFALRFALQI